MKVGIIGTGNIGGTLTRRLRKLGHDVNIASSRVERLLGRPVVKAFNNIDWHHLCPSGKGA